jgi:hypothetical protein
VKLSPVLLASAFLMASSAAADTPQERDAPNLWTRWARSLPALPLDTCEVEVESDLSFVRLSLSLRF